MKVALALDVRFKITPFSGLLVDLSTLKATRLSSRAAETLATLLNRDDPFVQHADSYQTQLVRALEQAGLVRLLSE